MFHLFSALVTSLLFASFIFTQEKNSDEGCKDFEIINIIHLNDERDPIRAPSYYIDKESNVIITDHSANNVKIFDKTGELLQGFGRYGRGPGDFEFPTSSVRKNDSIYTVTFGGKLTVWDFYTKEIHHIENLSLFHTSNIKLLNDSLVVISGVSRADNNIGTGNRLHLVNLNNHEIVHSFFIEPDEYLPYRGITSSISDIINFDVLGDKIVVSFGASPQVYIYQFDSDGVHLKQIQELGVSDNFESVLNHKISDLRDIRTSASKYSTVSRLFFLEDGNLVFEIRMYNPRDSSGEYPGAQYVHFYQDIDSQQTCMLSLKGSLAASDGKYIYEVSESDFTLIHKYKIGR